MLVQKVFPKTTSYLAMTVMLAGMSAPALMANNSVEKEEKRVEITNDSSQENNKKTFPWLDAISVGGILSLLGIFKIADYLDKKEQNEESSDSEK